MMLSAPPEPLERDTSEHNPPVHRIEFNSRWNNKLNCDCWTTFRIKNAKYAVGHKLLVFYKHGRDQVRLGTATILDTRDYKLNQVSPFVSYLDMGLDLEGFAHVVTTMYQKVKTHPSKLTYQLILCQWDVDAVRPHQLGERLTLEAALQAVRTATDDQLVQEVQARGILRASAYGSAQATPTPAPPFSPPSQGGVPEGGGGQS